MRRGHSYRLIKGLSAMLVPSSGGNRGKPSGADIPDTDMDPRIIRAPHSHGRCPMEHNFCRNFYTWEMCIILTLVYLILLEKLFYVIYAS